MKFEVVRAHIVVKIKPNFQKKAVAPIAKNLAMPALF